MSTPPASTRPEQTHLVSLVASKKALQHGEQLCSRANSLSNVSAQRALDVLALDAKVKWMTDAVLEQLKLAANVAKSIEQKRTSLEKRVQEWDSERVRRTDALDSVLESLGSQLVPPEFHQGSSESSLFGSQHSDEGADDESSVAAESSQPHLSPTATVRNGRIGQKSRRDRTKWKTLRDFVDERAIEDALETMDNDRTALDDILSATDGYSETLSNTISTIRSNLPESEPLPSTESILVSQERACTNMAGHLESLASHYDQMAGALRDSEAGVVFSEEDIQEMNRDTEELPAIIAELEENIIAIEAAHQQLISARNAYQEQLDIHRSILDDLDELGDIMTDMLQRQGTVEVDCETRLSQIQQHLLTLEELHHRYLQYQASFNKLLVEIVRRRQYREAAENIVKGMMAQLDAMTEEERQLREEFREEHGAHLPEDICLCIENPPTKWEVVPWNGEAVEALPEVDSDLLAEARDRITSPDGAVPGSESL